MDSESILKPAPEPRTPNGSTGMPDTESILEAQTELQAALWTALKTWRHMVASGLSFNDEYRAEWERLEKLTRAARWEYCPKHVRVMERPIPKAECDQCAIDEAQLGLPLGG